MKTVFLFPGQGSQKAGMLSSYSTDDPIVAQAFVDTASVLGQEAVGLDTAERLASTVYVQLSLLLNGVISARRLQAKGVQPDYVAGHSVGAFSAAVICGVLTLPEALKLVHTRATLMEKAYPKGYGMAAFTGISAISMSKMLQSYEELYLSNINAVDQQVVSGKVADLQMLMVQLERRGWVRKAQMLKTAVPSHCPLLLEVSMEMKVHLDQVTARKPVMPYAANCTGRLLSAASDIKTDLYGSLCRTLRWYDATTLLYELGSRIFIEMAPSGVLEKIAVSSFPEANVLALEPDTMERIATQYNNIISDNDL
jgi:malonate decarboxylase epsilon subunit